MLKVRALLAAVGLLGSTDTLPLIKVINYSRLAASAGADSLVTLLLCGFRPVSVYLAAQRDK
jgi:hypothetical protein